MMSLPALIAGLGPIWHGVIVGVGAIVWIVAARSVLRDLRRRSRNPHRPGAEARTGPACYARPHGR